MSQVMNVCIKNDHNYKSFKDVFNKYRNLDELKLAFKSFSNNAFTNNKFYGKILTIIFKLKIKCLFYFALKKYKKSKLNR